MIQTMWALLSAEAMKARRSAPMRLAVAAPALLFVLEILTLFARGHVNGADHSLLWRDLLSFAWIMWLGLFTPALIAAEAICLVNVEHSGRHWKQLFVLPIPRWQVFAAKMVFCGLLLAASFFLFVVSSLAAVLIFSGARGLNLAASVPWRDTVLTAAGAYVACWLLIVIHTWISVRFPGFAVPSGVCFAAMLVGFLLVNVNRDLFGCWYPWTLPLNVRPEGSYSPQNTLASALFGALAGFRSRRWLPGTSAAGTKTSKQGRQVWNSVRPCRGMTNLLDRFDYDRVPSLVPHDRHRHRLLRFGVLAPVLIALHHLDHPRIARLIEGDVLPIGGHQSE
jgi:lantibiotic transport system permease protein